MKGVTILKLMGSISILITMFKGFIRHLKTVIGQIHLHTNSPWFTLKTRQVE